MDCPACNAPVDESLSECPACGTDTRLTVRAPDGTSYGPYTLASIRQYAAEGRIPSGSTLQADDGQTLTLAELNVVPAPPAVARAAPARGGTSGWLVFAIVAAVLAVLLPMVAIMAAILFPVFAKAREKARQASCVSNVKQLSLACLQYASANNDTLPKAATWQQDVQPYLPPGFTWNCPSSNRGQQSYQFNAALSGQSLAATQDPANTVMISEPVGPSGGGPHNGGSNVGFADGHARWMLPGSLSQLQGTSGVGGMGP